MSIKRKLENARELDLQLDLQLSEITSDIKKMKLEEYPLNNQDKQSTPTSDSQIMNTFHALIYTQNKPVVPRVKEWKNLNTEISEDVKIYEHENSGERSSQEFGPQSIPVAPNAHFVPKPPPQGPSSSKYQRRVQVGRGGKRKTRKTHKPNKTKRKCNKSRRNRRSCKK